MDGCCKVQWKVGEMNQAVSASCNNDIPNMTMTTSKIQERIASSRWITNGIIYV